MSNKAHLLVANWKMNTTVSEGVALLEGILEAHQARAFPPTVLLPPFTHLSTIAARLQDNPTFRLGGQCCDARIQGAYTGGISVDMLAEVGASYVLVGHSERRLHFGEGEEVLFNQLRNALRVGIQPIFCCGEPQEVREQDQQNDHIAAQLAPLLHLPVHELPRVLVAYEPLWAIGTGQVATPEQANQVHQHIHQIIAQHRTTTTAERIPVLYGGSVQPDNAADLLACPYIDGVLVGGASLDAAAFAAIAAEARR